MKSDIDIIPPMISASNNAKIGPADNINNPAKGNVGPLAIFGEANGNAGLGGTPKTTVGPKFGSDSAPGRGNFEEYGNIIA